MKLPPAIVAVRLVEQGHTRFHLCLPLFLLWPLFLMLLLLTLLAASLADAAHGTTGRHHGYARLVWGGLNLLTEMKGAEVFLQDKLHTVAFTLR